jgi:hypothetical protein
VFAGLVAVPDRAAAATGGRKRALVDRRGLFGCTALGILCKESAVLLPLYAWLAEACVPALRNFAAEGRRAQVVRAPCCGCR